MVLGLGGSGPEPRAPDERVLGSDLESGQHPQLLVPPGMWQTARPLVDEPVLVSCVVVPGFSFEDFRLA